MTTYTPRLKLGKPNPVGEVVSVELFNQNAEEIDKYAGGPLLVTSTTRPPAPYVGLSIFETDTKFTLMWDGSDWVGRPWYIERYRSTNTALPANVNAFSWNDTRLGADNAVTGSAADWGLTTFTTEHNFVRAPATGLYSLHWRFWCVPGVARSYITRVFTGVPVGTPGVGGTNRETYSIEPPGNASDETSHLIYLVKGEELRFFAYVGSAVTVGPDNPTDNQARGYMRLLYLGRGNR